MQALSENARTAAESGFSRLAALKYGPEIPDTPAANVIAESRGKEAEEPAAAASCGRAELGVASQRGLEPCSAAALE